MDQHEWLAEQFETYRTHLRTVAYRILGSLSEAEDAVQESWLHLSRSDTNGVENLGGWLTTVVARVCLDMLRSRKSRREESLDLPASVIEQADGNNPEDEVMLADSVGLALLVVLETLAPAERLAFVLHDMFAVSFNEIAPIVGRTPTATRQLASRARRRVQGMSPAAQPDLARQHEIVDAFLAASRQGDFEALLAVLDPEVVFEADPAGVSTGATPVVIGATAVAGIFLGRAEAAQPALIDGAVGLVWAPGGQPRVVFDFTIADEKVIKIDLIADPTSLQEFDLTIL